MRLLVEGEVARLDDAFARARVGLAFLLVEQRHHLVHGDVQVGVVLGLPADDQGGAGLVDQDRVHFVDDGVVQAALDAVRHLVHHVVAQVVETELVVGPVGDVGTVRCLLFFPCHVRQVHAHAQAQVTVQLAHPLRIAVGQVVVHRDDVHALARQCIQVDRQRGRQRLAFTGAHLGDLALVQGHPAQQLDIEMAHLHHPLGALAHHGEGLRQDVVERLPPADPVLELLRLGAQRIVAELFELRLQRVDAIGRLPVLLEQAVVARTENLSQEVLGHERGAALSGLWGQRGSAILLVSRMKGLPHARAITLDSGKTADFTCRSMLPGECAPWPSAGPHEPPAGCPGRAPPPGIFRGPAGLRSP